MARKRKVSPGLSRLFILLSLALATMLVLGGSPAQPASAGLPDAPGKQAEARPQVLVMHVYFRSIAERDKLAVEFDAEEAPTLGGFITIIGERDAYNTLLSRGLRVEIDQATTALMNQPDPFIGGGPDTYFGGYRTVEENFAFMQTIAANYPGIAEVVDIGDSWCKTHPGQCTQPDSWNGYDLNVLHITNRSIAGPKPVFWMETGIHSREIAVPEMATRLMAYLTSGYNGLGGYDNDADVNWLVNYHDIWILPHVNPDGHHMAENGASQPRTQRKNADRDDGCTTYPPSDSGQLGTDLNRNFSFLWSCCGGSSGSPCNLTYRGSAVASEEETQAVQNQIRLLVPDQRGPNITDPAPLDATGVYQSMHTAAALNLFPWGFQVNPHAPNDADLRNVAKHMSAGNANPPGNNYTPGQPPEVLYAVDGDTADWGYGELGMASYTTELASAGTFFPSYSIIDSEWNVNRGALLYQAKIARTPYLLTRGPDTRNAVTSPMTVTQGVSSQLAANINYAWSSNTYSQNVSAAEYYVDVPPWLGGTAIPMDPTDGNFNSTTEGATATIDTSGIPAGRHVIFVRGRGVNDYGGFGSYGPIMAAWLTVTGGGSPTPTVTGTPPTATQTRTPTQTRTATNTPLATPTACGGTANYAVANGSAPIVPGTTNVGSSCDDCVTTVVIPFSFTLYDQSFTTVDLDSNGRALFPTGASNFTNTCLPSSGDTYTIFTNWDDQLTNTAGSGIFTSTSGSAPNRIFNIEWRTTYFSGTGTANYELRLYENTSQSQFEIIFGTVAQGNTSSTSGVQKDGTLFTQYFCNGSGGAATGSHLYTRPACGTGTPGTTVATNTSISTSTAVVSSTVAATATCSPSGGTQDVGISNFTFTPSNLTVPAGTTVRWTNNGGSHTTTSDTALWDSGVLAQGGQFSFTFNTPGTYPYHCSVHPGSMLGTITVQATVPCSTNTVVLPTSTRTGTAVSTSVSTGTQPVASATRTSTSVSTSVASATRTTAPGTALSTSTSGVSTATTVVGTATPAPCTITFSDVPQGSTFYTWIRCLACRNIISGYSDGTFRPGNEITRGQIAKMVSNAAGFSEDAGAQIYEDVPTDSPFYLWINRLSRRGFMGGYPCGLVPEEPCIMPGNRPYFRPSASATRGQLAKIVSNAAGLTGEPMNTFYTDVPPGHPFYVWVMRLTELGVMSGYPCGSENEPCDEANRPYFRPFNNVTRGQASKIVANTFFPNCQTPSR